MKIHSLKAGFIKPDIVQIKLEQGGSCYVCEIMKPYKQSDCFDDRMNSNVKIIFDDAYELKSFIAALHKLDVMSEKENSFDIIECDTKRIDGEQ